MHRIMIATALMWASSPVPCQSVSALSLSDEVREILENKITISPRPQRFTCRNEFLCGPNALLRFYTDRDFWPAWSADEDPLPQAATLVTAIQEADREGLRPKDYHLANIE
ncbi:MAG: hypothetical protein ACE5H0_14820, partial [Bacteroidota bacterium]